MKESDLSAPVSAWLEGRGYEVFAEVFYGGRVVDLVGRKGDVLVCVELKRYLTRTGKSSVINQARDDMLATPNVYVAVGSVPKDKGVISCLVWGIGLLVVKDGKVKVRCEPRREGRPGYYSKVLHARLNRRRPGGTGGVPSKKGAGPAQEVEGRVAAYRRGHRGASWRDVYENVENHYKNAASLERAMAKLQDRRFRSEMRKMAAGAEKGECRARA